LLVGNYGEENLGDEALMSYFYKQYPSVNWILLSSAPKRCSEYSRFPSGFRSFFKFSWIRTIFALIKSDGIVFGGGSLFTDVESSKACLIWWIQAFWAWIFRKPIILAFQGIGPFKTKRGEFLARWVVNHSTYISVRDPDSYERINSWGLDKKVIQSFDPVISLIEKKEFDLTSNNVLIVIPRRNSNTEFKKSLDLLLDSNRWSEVIILSMQPKNVDEMKLCNDLQSSIKIPSKIIPTPTLIDLVNNIQKGSFVITQRYHGAIAAIALGRELLSVPQENNDKIQSLANLLREIPLNNRRQYLNELVNEAESSLGEALSKFSK